MVVLRGEVLRVIVEELLHRGLLLHSGRPLAEILTVPRQAQEGKVAVTTSRLQICRGPIVHLEHMVLLPRILLALCLRVVLGDAIPELRGGVSELHALVLQRRLDVGACVRDGLEGELPADLGLLLGLEHHWWLLAEVERNLEDEVWRRQEAVGVRLRRLVLVVGERQILLELGILPSCHLRAAFFEAVALADADLVRLGHRRVLGSSLQLALTEEAGGRKLAHIKDLFVLITEWLSLEEWRRRSLQVHGASEAGCHQVLAMIPSLV